MGKNYIKKIEEITLQKNVLNLFLISFRLHPWQHQNEFYFHLKSDQTMHESLPMMKKKSMKRKCRDYFSCKWGFIITIESYVSVLICNFRCFTQKTASWKVIDCLWKFFFLSNLLLRFSLWLEKLWKIGYGNLLIMRYGGDDGGLTISNGIFWLRNFVYFFDLAKLFHAGCFYFSFKCCQLINWSFKADLKFEINP